MNTTMNVTMNMAASLEDNKLYLLVMDDGSQNLDHDFL